MDEQEGTPMKPPSHPEADDGPPGDDTGRNINWVIAVVGSVFLVVVVLHLTGVVGPLAH